MYDGKEDEADKEKAEIRSVADAEKAEELEIQEYGLLTGTELFRKHYADSQPWLKSPGANRIGS